MAKLILNNKAYNIILLEQTRTQKEKRKYHAVNYDNKLTLFIVCSLYISKKKITRKYEHFHRIAIKVRPRFVVSSTTAILDSKCFPLKGEAYRPTDL